MGMSGVRRNGESVDPPEARPSEVGVEADAGAEKRVNWEAGTGSSKGCQAWMYSRLCMIYTT